MNYYRQHPKDGGRYCFQFVSSHLDAGRTGVFQLIGGYPIPGLDCMGYTHPSPSAKRALATRVRYASCVHAGGLFNFESSLYVFVLRVRSNRA